VFAQSKITLTNVKQRLNFLNSCTWQHRTEDPCRIQITPQHNSLKTGIAPKLATAFRHPIYKHSTFLGHKVIRALPNARVLQWS